MEQKDERMENEAAENRDAVSVDAAEEQTPVTEDPQEHTEPAEEVMPEESAAPVEAPAAKPMDKKKMLIIVGAAAAAAVVLAVILIFAVFRPNSIYKDACEALEKQDFAECQQLLEKIPNHKNAAALDRKLNLAIAKNYIENGELDLADGILATMPGDTRAQELKGEVIYKRASDAIAHKKYDEGREYMDKIPNHEDPEQLRAKLTYQDALNCVEAGDYETGYELMSSLGDYEDAIQQKEMMYYEALAFRSLLKVQGNLKDPSSMRVTAVGFYENETDIDVAHEITGSNSYGGNVGLFVYDVTVYADMKEGKNNADALDFSSYNDPDNSSEELEGLIIYLIRQQKKLEYNVDIARMNRLLENKVTFKINLDFQSGETVEH